MYKISILNQYWKNEGGVKEFVADDELTDKRLTAFVKKHFKIKPSFLHRLKLNDYVTVIDFNAARSYLRVEWIEDRCVFCDKLLKTKYDTYPIISADGNPWCCEDCYNKIVVPSRHKDLFIKMRK